MKKSLFSILMVVCVAVMSVFTLTACNNSAQALNVKETYMLGVTAGVSYLKEDLNVSPKNMNSTSSVTLARPVSLENEISGLNEYVKMFEGYLLDNTKDMVVSSPDITEEIGKAYGDYTVDEHTIKMTFNVPKIDGTSEEYIVYYTETLIDNSGYVEADDDDEQEVNASLSGIAVVGEDIFVLQGHRKTEIEKDEYECELDLTIIKDSNNYIKMEYSTETETDEQENKFKFSVYDNGVLTSKTSIKFESEDNEDEMKLKFDDTANASKFVYKFKSDVKDGKNIIIVKYSNNTEKGTIEISENNGEYTYVYSNGFSESIAK